MGENLKKFQDEKWLCISIDTLGIDKAKQDIVLSGLIKSTCIHSALPPFCKQQIMLFLNFYIIDKSAFLPDACKKSVALFIAVSTLESSVIIVLHYYNILFIKTAVYTDPIHIQNMLKEKSKNMYFFFNVST